MQTFVRYRALCGIVLIAVLAVIAYWPALRGGFILDDDMLVTGNNLVNAPDGLYRMWLTTEPIDYWPLTNTSFWIEWRMWGANPTGYHVFNLLLHLSAALLLWAILAKLSIPGAYLAALLFAVHPVNVESVAWIAQRKNTLAMMFFLCSIFCYLRDLEFQRTTDFGPRTKWYWFSLLAFVLAMLSKGSVAILPLVLLLIVWWQSRRITLTDLWQTAPFFFVAVVLTGVNIWFQTQGGETTIRTASLFERFSGAGAVAWFYLSKAFLPIDLIFVYPQWHVEFRHLLWWLPLLAALAVTACLWWCGRHSQSHWARPLLFAWVFFCVALLPVLGIVDVHFMKFALVADHYQHIALIAVVTLVAAGFSAWYRSAAHVGRWGATVAAMLVVGTFVWLTGQQSGLYANATTLYQATLDRNPNCWLAHLNLGQEFLAAGQLLEAAKQFDQAIQLKPDLPEAHNNLGLVLAKTGRLEEARQHLERALQLKPNAPEYYANFAIELTKAGRHQEAIQYLQRAIELKPDYPDAHNNLAIELAQSNRLPEAIEHFQYAVQLKPGYFDAHKNLARALLQSNRPAEAIDQYFQALRLKPNNAPTYDAILNVYPALNRPTDAIATAQRALEMARASGQAALAEQIEAWLTSFRNQQGETQNAATPAPAARATP